METIAAPSALSASSTAVALPPDRKRPVFLVHGIDDTGRVFRRIERRLAVEGRRTYAIDLRPPNGQVPQETLAAQLAEFVRERTDGGRGRFDLVAFSMGGIVSRIFLQRLGGLERAGCVVFVSVPQHGSEVARLRWNPGGRQLRPGSALLADLNRDAERLAALPRLTSLWTRLDLMILPAASSRLPFGAEARLPVLLHPFMLTDRRSVEAIAEGVTWRGATDGTGAK